MLQSTALTIMQTGANVFLTGEPGSGKTHTVNAYIRYLKEHGIMPSVTASTGIAATHVGGMTIHSWSGIGIRRTISEYDLDYLGTNEALVKRIASAKVLIIDEISMLDGRVLGMVEQVTRAIRRREEAFGGLQIIMVGDFFQLPPIAERGDRAQFAFESTAWARANPVVCYLSEQHRQEDATFLSTLSAIRRGDLDDSVYEFLGERRVTVDAYPQDIPHLFTHNVDVDKKNQEELGKLSGEVHSFYMTTKGTASRVEQLMKGCLSPQALDLKEGASVMFTKNNFPDGYVNGTLGTIIGFDEDNGFPMVEIKNKDVIVAYPSEWSIDDAGKVLASISQLPLRLAWAITVHKSQGMSLDAALMDLSRSFEYGQGYVALSRVRFSSGLHLVGINQRACEVHPLVLNRDQHFRERSEDAEDGFLQMDEGALRTLHHDFIRAQGGSIEKKTIEVKEIKKSTHEETLAHLRDGKTLTEIASLRKLKPTTIIDHLETLRENKLVTLEHFDNLVTPAFRKKMPKIHKAFMLVSTTKLTPVYEALDKKYSYDDLRLARLFLPE